MVIYKWLLVFASKVTVSEVLQQVKVKLNHFRQLDLPSIRDVKHEPTIKLILRVMANLKDNIVSNEKRMYFHSL